MHRIIFFKCSPPCEWFWGNYPLVFRNFCFCKESILLHQFLKMAVFGILFSRSKTWTAIFFCFVHMVHILISMTHTCELWHYSQVCVIDIKKFLAWKCANHFWTTLSLVNWNKFTSHFRSLKSFMITLTHYMAMLLNDIVHFSHHIAVNRHQTTQQASGKEQYSHLVKSSC